MLHGRYDCRWAARINVRKRVALGRVNVRKRRVCERGSIRAETVTVAKILLPPGGRASATLSRVRRFALALGVLRRWGVGLRFLDAWRFFFDGSL